MVQMLQMNFFTLRVPNDTENYKTIASKINVKYKPICGTVSVTNPNRRNSLTRYNFTGLRNSTNVEENGH